MKKANFNLQEKIDILKSLDPNYFYDWPNFAKNLVGVAICILVIFLGYYFILSNQNEKLSVAERKEQSLKQDFLTKKRQAINLDLYQKQLVEITDNSNQLLKQLPNKSEVEKLLVEINQSGINRGLEFSLFKPGQEKMYDFYAELPILIKVEGNYNQIGQFVSDVSQLSRVVILSNIQLKQENSKLIMSATAKTFRYLDQQEIESQKAKALKERMKNQHMKK
jgi:type IV pilus assembly protein PilO